MTEEEIKKIKQLKINYCQTFGSEAGARVLKDLEARCFKNATTHTAEPNGIYINEGKRCVILTIESMMALDVDEIAKDEEELL